MHVRHSLGVGRFPVRGFLASCSGSNQHDVSNPIGFSALMLGIRSNLIASAADRNLLISNV